MQVPYYEGFDYGGVVADKEDNVVLWPTEGNRVCLVDADLLPYKVGFTIDTVNYLTAKTLVEEGCFPRIEDTPQFESAFDQLCSSLNRWVRDCKCDAAILYSTESSSNFRLDIAYTNPYKGQRPAEKPPFFSELKQAMTERLGCVLVSGMEADDALSMEASRRMNLLLDEGAGSAMKDLADWVVASSDKDSTITPGWNYNPDTRKLRWINRIGTLEPKYKNAMVNHYEYIGTGKFWTKGEKAGQEKTTRVLVGKKPSTALDDLKGTGLMFFYAQIIMGDAADNYKGLKGRGLTAAYEALCNCRTEKDMYMTVLAMYKEVYGTGKHWCPHYKGTQEYYDLHCDVHGTPPPDWEVWKGRGAYLTAYDRMLEQGRLAWMWQCGGDVWRKDKGATIDPHDLEFWKYADESY